ncbi:hypothetical protein SESBI_30998 [Sesbania bispinosa]|nr:hypothetical protein SESBI_30998 [Sesbania bispinosa]
MESRLEALERRLEASNWEVIFKVTKAEGTRMAKLGIIYEGGWDTNNDEARDISEVGHIFPIGTVECLVAKLPSPKPSISGYGTMVDGTIVEEALTKMAAWVSRSRKWIENKRRTRMELEMRIEMKDIPQFLGRSIVRKEEAARTRMESHKVSQILALLVLGHSRRVRSVFGIGANPNSWEELGGGTPNADIGV